jgi:hypothetical protein
MGRLFSVNECQPAGALRLCNGASFAEFIHFFYCSGGGTTEFTERGHRVHRDDFGFSLCDLHFILLEQDGFNGNPEEKGENEKESAEDKNRKLKRKLCGLCV